MNFFKCQYQDAIPCPKSQGMIFSKFPRSGGKHHCLLVFIVWHRFSSHFRKNSRAPREKNNYYDIIVRIHLSKFILLISLHETMIVIACSYLRTTV